jgi:phytoene dehydrogenase-like protein
MAWGMLATPPALAKAKGMSKDGRTFVWMSDEQPRIVIVGAGLAGLACARVLAAAGRPFRILEASNAVGGRVRTDVVDGFLLDRGFQVFLPAYPEARRVLDYEALDLRPIYRACGHLREEPLLPYGGPAGTPPHGGEKLPR